jgi:hypothetical protein
MKTIQAIPIWDNGKTLNANVLDAHGIHIVLGTSAVFKYSLFSEKDGALGHPIAQGALSMTKDDYLQWKDDDSFIWNWVASKLGATITGEYTRVIPK